MPGELGNEEEQQGVGYYEKRYSPDDTANMPREPLENMKKRTNTTSVMKVLRDHVMSQQQE